MLEFVPLRCLNQCFPAFGPRFKKSGLPAAFLEYSCLQPTQYHGLITRTCTGPFTGCPGVGTSAWMASTRRQELFVPVEDRLVGKLGCLVGEFGITKAPGAGKRLLGNRRVCVAQSAVDSVALRLSLLIAAKQTIRLVLRSHTVVEDSRHFSCGGRNRCLRAEFSHHVVPVGKPAGGQHRN